MKREIKFRAFINPDEGSDWDTGKEMVYDLAFQQYDPINDLLAKVPTLMQYTGLKDKNGVEIYEGDIVAKENLCFEVVWSQQNGCWWLSPISDDIIDAMYNERLGNGYLNRKDLEIIGNIHQNLELL